MTKKDGPCSPQERTPMKPKPSKWIRKRAKQIYKTHNEETVGGIAGAFDMAIMEYLDEQWEAQNKDKQ